MKREVRNGRPLQNDEPILINELESVYPNYIEAAKAIDGNRSCVYLCVKGFRKSHKGYTFSVLDKQST